MPCLTSLVLIVKYQPRLNAGETEWWHPHQFHNNPIHFLSIEDACWFVHCQVKMKHVK
jgi:hypothetical protein